MNQSLFEQTCQEQWQQFRLLLEAMEAKSTGTVAVSIPMAEFPRRYRRLCNHYCLARTRHYSPALLDSLHGLVLRGHRQLYKKKTRFIWAAIGFIARDFPRTLRQEIRTDRKSEIGNRLPDVRLLYLQQYRHRVSNLCRRYGLRCRHRLPVAV